MQFAIGFDTTIVSTLFSSICATWHGSKTRPVLRYNKSLHLIRTPDLIMSSIDANSVRMVLRHEWRHDAAAKMQREIFFRDGGTC